MATKTVFLAAGTSSTTLPSDFGAPWQVICIGRGGNGATQASAAGGGGGGGACSSISDHDKTYGANQTVNVQIGDTSSAVTTIFDTATNACVADYGRDASAGTSGAGGLVANSTGGVIANLPFTAWWATGATAISAGGAGGNTSSGGTSGFSAGGGGGAGGPHGVGAKSGDATSTSSGARSGDGGGGADGGGVGGAGSTSSTAGIGGTNRLGSGAGAAGLSSAPGRKRNVRWRWRRRFFELDAGEREGRQRFIRDAVDADFEQRDRRTWRWRRWGWQDRSAGKHRRRSGRQRLRRWRRWLYFCRSGATRRRWNHSYYLHCGSGCRSGWNRADT
jgi:hypothetical protein